MGFRVATTFGTSSGRTGWGVLSARIASSARIVVLELAPNQIDVRGLATKWLINLNYFNDSGSKSIAAIPNPPSHREAIQLMKTIINQ